MGMMKNYLLKLLEQCSEEKFGQDAIEWAILSGLLPLTYELDHDVRETMSRYDEIIEAYRRSQAQADNGQRKPHVPIKRAVAGRRTKTADLNASIERRNAA